MMKKFLCLLEVGQIVWVAKRPRQIENIFENDGFTWILFYDSPMPYRWDDIHGVTYVNAPGKWREKKSCVRVRDLKRRRQALGRLAPEGSQASEVAQCSPSAT